MGILRTQVSEVGQGVSLSLLVLMPGVAALSFPPSLGLASNLNALSGLKRAHSIVKERTEACPGPALKPVLSLDLLFLGEGVRMF